MPAPAALLRPLQRNRPPAFLLLVVFRLLNAWCVRTFFQPDEFFQSLEPAWQLAFGPGSGAWLTWEWHHRLRSSLHPAVFAAAYRLAHLPASMLLPPGHVLRAAAVVGSPKLLQAVSAALCDWYTWQLAVNIFGPDGNLASSVALLLQLVSPWQWYCSTRTFSNSLETTLCVAALYYWPWRLFAAAAAPTKENPRPVNAVSILGSTRRLRASLSLAALAVVLRPTNLLIWATVAAMALARPSLRGASPVTRPVVFALAREAALCGSVLIAISAASDRLYFGSWAFPPYNWLDFNISKSLAVFYGRSPWHYYLSQGIPLLCTTSLPFALVGLCRPAAASSAPAERNVRRVLSCTVLTTVCALSLISHKEVRFIYPLLPILNVLAAPHAAAFFFFTTATTPPPPADAANGPAPRPRPRPRIRRKPWLLAALGVNLALAGYLSFLHQPAPLAVVSYLRKEYERLRPAPPPIPGDELFALFLTPCHSTPWRSHLYHPGLNAYALTCEPPLHTRPNTPERDGYRDEADRFYDDPATFLGAELFSPRRNMSIPRYIVGFQGIEPWLRDFLRTPRGSALGISLRRVWSGFNGFFNEDWRRAGRLLVWDTGLYEGAPFGDSV
ncbi:uncharacterized protein UV8b_06540 [Ustilaginoidea virens]|uniref:Mannosyltransferase n=1 Tax=Ustilaginoidea virens TaxID=1159556 RepID=A0A8E5HVG6_USTVR|nr:uncharacterized protein UV8b_06540 [Ustilaginoidea virens]QUC22299.1 hypothetical protein UV8b_06540 [Ustilaginoidea virens]